MSSTKHAAAKESLPVPSQNEYFLSRIDRSIADNINDIQKSFGEDAPIVMDFIVFLSKKLKENFFGFAKFSLNEFAAATGWNKQDLCALHPSFERNPKQQPPEYYGHKFKTVLDYTLYNMLQKNIIFSKAYTYHSKNEQEIILENFPILKDIKLNINRSNNAVKVYDVRASDQLLNGFLERYYTLESNGYSKVGKGRGGSGRKKLFITIYKTRHILITQKKEFTSTFPLDYLASIAGVDVKKNSDRKKSMTRILNSLRSKSKGNIPFTYKWTKANPSNTREKNYYCEINFFTDKPITELSEKSGDNYFFKHLYKDLKEYYSSQYEQTYKDEKDAFQKWLNQPMTDLDPKANILVKAYMIAYGINMTFSEAKHKIKEGLFSKS